MHRRYEHANIPIEILRTFVCVVEDGSFSKAGHRLNLSQPAITAQMKRLQTMVGGPVFDRGNGGTPLTALGKLVLSHAKRILQENDQILSLGGATSDSRPLRVGFPTVFAEDFLKLLASNGCGAPLTFHCAHSVELDKGLADGYLDIACLAHPPPRTDELDCDWTEELVWVRSRNFVLSPGSPIPFVGWPGGPQVQPPVQALENHGAAYRVVLTSYDYSVRVAAVAAGIGIMTLPRRQVKAPLVVARDYYLPRMDPITIGIRSRANLPANERAEDVIRLLMMLAPKETEPQLRVTNSSV